MSVIQGILGFNSKTERFGVLVMDLWEIDGLRCGEALEVWDKNNEEWVSTRIEKHLEGDWYLVGLTVELEGLRVRLK